MHSSTALLFALAAPAAAKSVWATPHDSYSSSIGVLGCKINTDRVAYWPASVDCDNICVKVSYKGRSVHLLRIDQSQGAYDISYDAWTYLQTGSSASEDPITGGSVAMEYEEVDASECSDLILTKGGKLPLSASNSINFLTSCLDQPSSYVAKNHVLYNICDAVCSLGHDEECELDLDVSNQPSCPHTLGLTTKLTTAPVYDVKYESGDTVDAGTGDSVAPQAKGSGESDSGESDSAASDSVETDSSQSSAAAEPTSIQVSSAQQPAPVPTTFQTAAQEAATTSASSESTSAVAEPPAMTSSVASVASIESVSTSILAPTTTLLAVVTSLTAAIAQSSTGSSSASAASNDGGIFVGVSPSVASPETTSMPVAIPTTTASDVVLSTSTSLATSPITSLSSATSSAPRQSTSTWSASKPATTLSVATTPTAKSSASSSSSSATSSSPPTSETVSPSSAGTASVALSHMVLLAGVGICSMLMII